MFLHCICLGKCDIVGGCITFFSLSYEPFIDARILQMHLKMGSLSCHVHTLLAAYEQTCCMGFTFIVCVRSLTKMVVWVCSHVLECVILCQFLASCLTVRHQLRRRPRGNVADHPRLGGKLRWGFWPLLYDSGDRGLVDVLPLFIMNALPAYIPLIPWCRALYTKCLRRNLPYSGRPFLNLIYIDITRHTISRVKQLQKWYEKDAIFCGSAYCTCLPWCVICTLSRSIL